jgi:4-amino-4-deoxy-L-arabinose transferase-like glycosyltransferase
LERSCDPGPDERHYRNPDLDRGPRPDLNVDPRREPPADYRPDPPYDQRRQPSQHPPGELRQWNLGPAVDEDDDTLYDTHGWRATSDRDAMRPLVQGQPARRVTYRVPVPPPAGWSAAASKRRTWIARSALLGILAVQALLSLRLHNTAFEDEALYIVAGRVELAHLLHHGLLYADYGSYFSGYPMFYPLIAGAIYGKFGLTGVRVLSLLLMLACTGLLYGISRRLFNERAALAAAAVFAFTQPTLVLGWFATFDALALVLLALATWLVVRSDRSRWPIWLLAAPLLVAAVIAKYAAGIFVPSVVAVAVLSAWPLRGPRAIWRGLGLTAAVASLGFLALHYTNVFAGVQQTTTNRAHGTDPTSMLLTMSLDWGGLALGAALWGAVSFTRRERMSEVTDAAQEESTLHRGTGWRLCLSVVMCGSALLAPVYQIYLHTDVSLHKHIGYGLFFAAPMAGVGLTRMMGPHFRRAAIGILFAAMLLASGIAQSQWRFNTWPNSTQLIGILRPWVNPYGHYLADAYEVPQLYLYGPTNPSQWASTFAFFYTTSSGKTLSGPAAYRAAIGDGYFDIIVLDNFTSPGIDQVVRQAVSSSPQYRLLAKLPFTNEWGAYTIWVKA